MLSLAVNERQTLSFLIYDPEKVDFLSENYFVTDLGIDLFETLKELRSLKLNFSHEHIVSVGNKKNKEIDFNLVNKLIRVDFDVDSFSYYASRLKEEFAKNRIQNSLLKDALVISEDKDKLDIEKLRTVCSDILCSLDQIDNKKNIVFTASEAFSKYMETFDPRSRGVLNYSTGDSFLDQLFPTGFQPNFMSTLFSATGIGKSAYALHLINKQINLGIPCMYISLEMDLVSTWDRLLAMRLKIPASDLGISGKGEVEPYIFDLLEEEERKLKKVKKFGFVEEPGLSLDNIRSLIIEEKKRMGVNYMVVTIDLLTMVDEFSNSKKVHHGGPYEPQINKLHSIAKELNVHFVNVVQANRESYKAKIRDPEEIKKLIPQTEDIKNSGAIAERSRNVMSLFRPKYYIEKFFPDEKIDYVDDIFEVRSGKYTQGKANQILKYLYNPEFFSFLPYIDDEES